MLRRIQRLVNGVLGSASRVAEGLYDQEARLALQRGRPPDWKLRLNRPPLEPNLTPKTPNRPVP
jgi:hypothetical protein